jgi:hypothetical protein
MSSQINISKLFSNVFGYEVPPKLNIPAASAKQVTSKLGQPYYADDIYGREFFMPVTIDGLLIPFAVMSIGCRKTIIETSLPERQGSVKEIISIEDYQINVKGFIISPNDDFPEDEIIRLEQLFTKNASLEMRSVLTDIFLKGDFDHHIVVKNINFPANPGVQHAKPFELDCLSDSIFDLKIK